MTRPLAKTTHGEIVETRPEDAVLGFYTMDGTAAGILAANFDVKEEMGSIIDLIRDPDPKIRAIGHRLFRGVLRDVAKVNGLVGTFKEVHQSSDGEGNQVKRIVSTQNLLTRFQKDREREQSRPTDSAHLEHRAAASGLPGDSESDRLPDGDDAAE